MWYVWPTSLATAASTPPASTPPAAAASSNGKSRSCGWYAKKQNVNYVFFKRYIRIDTLQEYIILTFLSICKPAVRSFTHISSAISIKEHTKHAHFMSFSLDGCDLYAFLFMKKILGLGFWSAKQHNLHFAIVWTIVSPCSDCQIYCCIKERGGRSLCRKAWPFLSLPRLLSS